MSRRLPILPTLIVLAAVLAMVGLGFWQLSRRAEKQALIARANANLSRPPAALPPTPGADWLFRRVVARCPMVTGWRAEAGRAADGSTGWRHIATCGASSGQTGFAVDLGISADPRARPRWRGGPVVGTLGRVGAAPGRLARMAGRTDGALPLLVADAAAPGLRRSARPDPASLPNNHLGYAIQWFAFAGIALLIYLLALRRRPR